eukprot:TRINITY_DN8947_c0_g1_i1.p1 TRINITY_DN8947_c0_g1~~TRINITY_DN8947_c0_g1_i1.p1  ORF type:complete len:512 (+),score=68.13 TRINITY_DN8947_c0_g1_i1:230-1537(+)
MWGEVRLDEIVAECTDVFHPDPAPDMIPKKPEIFAAYLLRSVIYSLQGLLTEAQKDIASASTALRDIEDLDFQSEFSSKVDKIASALEEDIKSQRRPPIAASLILAVAETMDHPMMKKLVDLYLGQICRQLYTWGHVQDAIQFCERARKIIPSSIDALHAVEAEALDSLGKTDLALLFLREYVQEKEELRQKIDPATYATLAYLCAGYNRPAEAIKYAILVPKVTQSDVRIAKRFLTTTRSPSTLRNAIDLLEAKLARSTSYDYESRRAQIFLAELHLELDELDQAESILRDAVPAFNPRAWIPFSKPLVSEGHAEALIAWSKLLQKCQSRGETVRVLREWDTWVIWLALLLCISIVVVALIGEQSTREMIDRFEKAMAKHHQNHQEIRDMQAEVDSSSQANVRLAESIQKRADKALRDIATSSPLDVDYIPKKP